MDFLSIALVIFLNGLVLGGVFLIVAIGLNIIYGLNRVMNLAHGSLYALGAYFGWTLVTGKIKILYPFLESTSSFPWLALEFGQLDFVLGGMNFFIALIFAPILVGLVGFIIERVLIEPMRKRPMVYTLILTYGLMFFIDGIIKANWGDTPYYIPKPEFLVNPLIIDWGQEVWFTYPMYRFFLLIGVAAAMSGLMLLLGRTRLGINMRAASDIPEMVSALGINLKVVRVGAFVLGCMLAGIAGFLVGPQYPILPIMGHDMLISSFVVIVIGGLGSLRGVIVAALLVGFVQALAEATITNFAMVIVYMMMALILIFKPRGILGEGKFE